MRASEHPSIGSSSSSQGVLGQRLRREQIATPKTIVALGDTAVTQATHRQHIAYDITTGRWINIPPDDILFPGPGAVQVATSPRYYFRDGGGYVLGLVATLDTAGTTSTVLQLLKNGASIAGSSTTLTSGANVVTTSLTFPGTAFGGPYTDYLQVQVTSAGTNAANLNVHVQRG